jgi:hypothetical protein
MTVIVVETSMRNCWDMLTVMVWVMSSDGSWTWLKPNRTVV